MTGEVWHEVLTIIVLNSEDCSISTINELWSGLSIVFRHRYENN